VREAPRRRRSEDDSGSGGGLPLFPLILVVVFAGLLLGGILAQVLGGRSGKVAKAPSQPAFTVAPLAAASPIATAAPVVSATPSAHPSPSASPKPAATSSPTPRPPPSPKAIAKSVPMATRAVVYITPAPLRTAMSAASAVPATVAAAQSPAPNYLASGSDQAVQIVRSYLVSLARGDRPTATTYLAHGLPSEGFVDSSSRILSIRPESSGNQQYKVTADVRTESGEYYITFMLQPGPGGLQITDHDSILVAR
jgi:hypothetical protein